jgi:hypothetical protein
VSKGKVGVAGYGVIGQRLADGVARQDDMELVGVADVAATLPIRALPKRGMPYRMFAAVPGSETQLEDAGVPVSGNFDDLLSQVDIMLDSAPGGIGAKNKEKYQAAGVKAVFQGEEAGEVADGFDTNTSLFNYARYLGHPRGDMYEVGLFEETVGMSGEDLMFAINIPQEPVVIPETIDGIRAALEMQTDGLEAVDLTNKYLGVA